MKKLADLVAKHPAITLVGFLITIVGFVLSLTTFESWDLRAYSPSPRAVIVSGSKVEDLKVTYRNAPIWQSVCVAQILVWNDGNTVITKENFYEPLEVVLGRDDDDAQPRLLAVSVLKETRPKVSRVVTDFEFHPVDNMLVPYDDSCTVTLTALEPGDGFVLQVIYAGAPNARLGINGSLTRQSKVAIQSETPQPSSSHLIAMLIMVVTTVGMLMGGLGVIRGFKYLVAKMENATRSMVTAVGKTYMPVPIDYRLLYIGLWISTSILTLMTLARVWLWMGSRYPF